MIIVIASKLYCTINRYELIISVITFNSNNINAYEIHKDKTIATNKQAPTQQKGECIEKPQ